MNRCLKHDTQHVVQQDAHGHKYGQLMMTAFARAHPYPCHHPSAPCRSASTSLLVPAVSPLLLLDLPLACSTLQQPPRERMCPQGLLAHLPQVIDVNPTNA